MPYAFCILVSALLVTYTRHLTVTPFAVVHDTVVLPVLLAVIFRCFHQQTQQSDLLTNRLLNRSPHRLLQKDSASLNYPLKVKFYFAKANRHCKKLYIHIHIFVLPSDVEIVITVSPMPVATILPFSSTEATDGLLLE